MKARRANFPLVRYFAWMSLGCMLLVAVPMGYTLHRYSQGALEQIAEERNVGYGDFITNGLWPDFREFALQAGKLPADALRAAPETRQMNDMVVGLLSNSGVLKVKIFSPEGYLYFSTEPAQIGLSQPDYPGVTAAAEGRVYSEIAHRDSFQTFGKTLYDRDILSSYVPVREKGEVVAIFELYSDITPFYAKMRGLRVAVASTVGLSVLLLYGLLSYLIWRAKKIIDRQRAALAVSNRMLEARVKRRTKAIEETNERLKAEVVERLRAETDLRLSATVFENTGEGVVIADREQRIVAVNRAFSDITGYSEKEVVGKTPRVLQSGRQNEVFYLTMWESLAERGQWAGEIWNRRKNGEIYPEWLTVSAVHSDDGELTHYVGVFSDITELKASQDRLEYLAHHDVLTGLPNRVQLSLHLSSAIAHARELDHGFALLFIDLDHFKHVNDTLGHPVGDKLLHAAAAILRQSLGQAVLVARVGGDEFVALLPTDRSGEDAAAEAATSVLLALSEPFLIDEHQLYVGASIGIVRYPEDGETADVLLAHADAAMYRAKAQGRNSWCVYGPEMSERARDRLALGSSLRKAIEEDRLFLQYQPQVEIATGRLVGVEALVRMRHPQLGVIGPAKFIELAEEDGMIRQLGQWVLRESCRAMARWRATGAGVPKVAVNVSVSQLERIDLPQLLIEVLQENNLPPECIEIEITESVIMNADDAIGKLCELRAIGVSLAIDDFGTGYSSLSYLRKLPVQKLKIDRSFFVDLTHQSDALAVVRSIVSLARNLGMKTVAEGVETDAQLKILRAEGCDVVQGFLYSKALDEQALVHFADTMTAAPACAASIVPRSDHPVDRAAAAGAGFAQGLR